MIYAALSGASLAIAALLFWNVYLIKKSIRLIERSRTVLVNSPLEFFVVYDATVGTPSYASDYPIFSPIEAYRIYKRERQATEHFEQDHARFMADAQTA